MTVFDLAQRLDARRNGNGWLAKCPAHEDRKPSLAINEGRDGRVLLHCHGGCTLEAVLAAAGLAKKDLFPESAHWQSDNGSVTREKPKREQRPEPFDWQGCADCFDESHAERLEKERGYGAGFGDWLHDAGLIGIIAPNHFAFPVRHNGKVVGAHWQHAKTGEWHYYPKGIKAAPLVVGELHSAIHVFESQWDAFAFMDASGERDGIIITRGAQNGALVANLIPERATACLWPQNDAPGEKKWPKDVCANTKATVRRAKIPSPHKDLNDWTRAGATADDLLGAVENAETIGASLFGGLQSATLNGELQPLQPAAAKAVVNLLITRDGDSEKVARIYHDFFAQHPEHPQSARFVQEYRDLYGEPNEQPSLTNGEQ